MIESILDIFDNEFEYSEKRKEKSQPKDDEDIYL